MRVAAGETNDGPPPPQTDPSESGTGGPDDAGDVDVDPADLNMPGHA